MRISLLVVSIFMSALSLKAQSANSGPYLEDGGLVVMDTESGDVVSPWVSATDLANFLGDGYLLGTQDFFGSPGNGVIRYPFQITTGGRYQMQWRSQIAIGNKSTEHNDSWARITDENGVPVATASNSNVAKNNWYKVYMNSRNGWNWQASNKDNDARSLSWNLTAGETYYFEISVRSNGHAVDRIVLWDRARHSLADISRGDGTDEAALNALSLSQRAGGSSVSVSFASLTNGATFNAPASFQPEALVTDTDGTFNGNIRLFLDGTLVRQENLAPWQWGLSNQPDTELENLPEGTYTFELLATASDGDTATASVTVNVGAPTILSLPGRIEAEDFDEGAQNSAYFDTTTGNAGGEYRDTDVDIGVANEGGFSVGWVRNNEYLNYTVDVVATGSYDFTFRVATANSTDKTLHVEMNGVDVTGPVTFNTGGAGWQSFQDVVVTGVQLNAGNDQELRVVMDSDSFNLNYFEATVSPGSNEPIRIEAEDFDDGGQNVGYFDTTSGNTGGEYRNTDVDIGVSSEGGFTVGWIRANEYLNYTVDITVTDTYDFTFRMASGQSSDKTFHIEVDGVDVSGPVTFNTGGAGWQVWQDVVVPGISLNAGNDQEIRIVMDSNSFNFSYFDIAPAN